MATRLVTAAFKILELPVANGNFMWNRNGSVIDKVILHTMDGTWKSANTRFNNPGDLQHASVHYGVPLDANTPILHWVDETNTSYNCGNWDANLSSIGIEHEDNGDYDGVRPDILYTRSAMLVRDICLFYGLPIDSSAIKKHNDFYATGCPDKLDVDRIIREAANMAQDIATLLRSDANQIVTLASVLLDTIDKLQVDNSVKYQMGFEAAEIKRKMGAPEPRYSTNNH